MKAARCATGALLLAAAPAIAQSPDQPLDSSRARGSTLVPLPVIFYQPETGTGFGLVATYFFRTPADTAVTQPSAARLIAVYTTKRQIILQVGTQLYTAAGRNWMLGQLDFSEFPTKYWGMGSEAPESQVEDYTPRVAQGTLEVQRRVRPGLYLGVVARAGHRDIITQATDGLIAGGAAPGAAPGWVVGAGLVASRDTRSSVVYPRHGAFHQLRTLVYDGRLGSRYDFAVTSLDLRLYRTTAPGHVLAARGLAVVTSGSPPFDLVPQVGGDVLLRGYYQGRFRDRHLVALETEYRMPLVWRLGVVAFVGAGRVARRLGDLSFSDLKTSAGGGLRVLLSPQEGLNIRADWAYGFDVKSTGFYLSIGEAF